MTWAQLGYILVASVLGAIAYALAAGRRPEPWYSAFPIFCALLVYGIALVLLPALVH